MHGSATGGILDKALLRYLIRNRCSGVLAYSNSTNGLIRSAVLFLIICQAHARARKAVSSFVRQLLSQTMHPSLFQRPYHITQDFPTKPYLLTDSKAKGCLISGYEWGNKWRWKRGFWSVDKGLKSFSDISWSMKTSHCLSGCLVFPQPLLEGRAPAGQVGLLFTVNSAGNPHVGWIKSYE